MLEFHFSATVFCSKRNNVVPMRVKEVVSAANWLDAHTQFNKKMRASGKRVHFILEVDIYRVNIRKERVLITKDELDDLEESGEKSRIRNLVKPDLFKRRGLWA